MGAKQKGFMKKRPVTPKDIFIGYEMIRGYRSVKLYHTKRDTHEMIMVETVTPNKKLTRK